MPTNVFYPLYSLILNDIEFGADVEIPYCIGQDWIIRRADGIYQSDFRHHVANHVNRGSPAEMPIPYELCAQFPRTSGGVKLISIPQKDFRYTIIEPVEQNNHDYETHFEETLRLCSSDLWIGLMCHTVGRNDTELAPRQIVVNTTLCNVFYGSYNLYKPPQILTSKHLLEIDEISKLRSGFNETKFRSIVKSIKNFLAGDLLPSQKHRDLNTFSVLEGILSHAPVPTDTYDSIRKQLARNVILLNNRASPEHQIEYDGKEMAKILNEMYSYRSAIAHGGDVEKSLKEIVKRLKNKEDGAASELLRRILKMVLIQALKEPKLVTDLK